MAILLLKSTTEPKCPTALPFALLLGFHRHTDWPGNHKAQLLTHLLDASPGELAQSVCSVKMPRRYASHLLGRRFCSNPMLPEVSLSPVLSQPWLGHQISSFSLAGVLQHHHFLPQPSLPLQFLQVEISSIPAPCRQIPSCFHSGVNSKRGGHKPEP